MSQAEASAYKKAVTEQFFDGIGRGIGADIEVFRGASHKEITYRAPDEVSSIAGIGEAIEYSQSLWVDIFA